MSYRVDHDEILFRKTLKFSLVFYCLLGLSVTVVRLPIPKQADIRHLSDRVAKLILEPIQAAPQPKVAPQPKIVPPRKITPPPKQSTPKKSKKKVVVNPKLKPVKPPKKNISKKKTEKPKKRPQPSVKQNREIVRKSGLLASLIEEEAGGMLNQIMENTALDEALSEVNVISSRSTKKGTRSQLRTMHRSVKNPLVDKKIAELGHLNNGEGVQLAKRETVTVTQMNTEHGGADGKGHGLGRGIGLQLKGEGSGNTAIDYDAIARVVEKYKGGLVFLYNKALRANPTLKGTVTVEFSINENGKVIDAQITTSTMDHADLEKALARRIKMWKFPKLYHGIIVVTYPFVFFPV